MRKSQAAVVVALVLAVAAMLVLAVWVRVTAEPVPELSGERASRSYDLAGFAGVELGGAWQATIERADAWRVAVEVPAELVDEIEAELRGDRVRLGYEGGWRIGGFRDGLSLKATIAMPALEALDVSGATKLSFAGFDGPSLSIDASGASEITGAASRFDALSLDLSGAVKVELADVTVTNADAELSGAANATLRLAGGRLAGELSGAASLEYYGTAGEERVDRSGAASVRRRD